MAITPAPAEESPRMHMAIETRHWTLEEMYDLPEDGNIYELIDGELLVSPAPTPRHEGPATRLARLLDKYAQDEQLGFAYRPQAVFRIGRRVEVEPDVHVRAELDEEKDWEDQPLPLLVVEVHSPRSRKVDLTKKRDVYLGAGIPEYWTVDPAERTVTVHRAGREPEVMSGALTWWPAGASKPLVFDVSALWPKRR
jgi:Uma2 family endonuclease